MKLKTTFSGKMLAFDFTSDLLENELLYFLCKECNLSVIFLEIYSVDSRMKDLFQELYDLGFDTVSIPYKDKFQDIALKVDLSRIPVLIQMISEYDFDEITVWDGCTHWEQHLFRKSARRKIEEEDTYRFYLCYNSSEKKVELYCDPNFSPENIINVIEFTTTYKMF
ncbi:MAG: hypothetical protein LBU61_04015 [Coriobacteriales bacterium]|jgi:hypothetical protein|nr:hypothetical protein [Coriobacteriales bacterium]